mgnify:CR=1 FL=1
MFGLLERTGEDEEGEGIVLETPSYPWEGSDRDYTYEEVCKLQLSHSTVMVP